MITLVEQELVVLLAEAAETKLQTDYWLGGRETEAGWVWASSGAPLLDGSWAGAWWGGQPDGPAMGGLKAESNNNDGRKVQF